MKPALALVLLLGAFAATLASSGAAEAPSPIPRIEQTRMTAEYGRRRAFLPSWTPPGFRFHSWAIDGGSFGFLLDRLRIRFRNRTSDLLWEVASGHPAETADRATCERSGRFRRIYGRKVYDLGDDTAYVCIWAKGPLGTALLAVSVRDVTRSPKWSGSEVRARIRRRGAWAGRSRSWPGACGDRGE